MLLSYTVLIFVIVDCDTLILEEDNAFAGFVPLLEAIQDPVYVQRPYDKVCDAILKYL